MTNNQENKYLDVFDLSNYTKLQKWSWKSCLRQKFLNHFVGISKLYGNGSAVDDWPDIEYELVRIGIIGYIELVKGDWRVARIATDPAGTKQLKTTRGGVQEVRFYLVDDASKEEIWGGQGEKPEHVKDVNWIGDRFVIFRNNKTGSGMLGADFDKQCEDLDDFYASIKWDIGQSKKRFILILPEEPDEQKWADTINSWEIGILTLITLLKEPSSKGRGIKLADIKYDVYYDQEGGKQREQLWKDLYNLLSITKSFNGIRHILADQEGEKERQSVPETFISNSEFDAWEYLHWHERQKVLNELASKQGGRARYKLKYGNYEERYY